MPRGEERESRREDRSRSRRRRRHQDEEAVLPPTTGALGIERPKKKRRSEKGEKVGTSALDRIPIQNPPVVGNVLPAHTDAPAPPPENLAGVPELQRNNWQGVESAKWEHVRPWVNSNLNAESSIHFVVHTGAYEWVHFDRNAVSVVLYTTYKNANYAAGAVIQAGQPDAGQPHAFNRTEWPAAVRGTPAMFLDPDVGARGFFSRVEVIINDQLVPTNGCLGSLFPHYSRVSAIFGNERVKRRKAHFRKLSDWDFGNLNTSEIMQAATEMFAQRSYNHDQGRRIYVPLDGVFPFDCKSGITQAIENVLPYELYLGPSTKFEVKLYFMPARVETIFHHELTREKYYQTEGAANAVAKPAAMRLTFQSAVLEYLSLKLLAKNHIDLMARFRRGTSGGYWNFDIPRGQHQPLTGGVSYTENTFQIFAYCRALVILFLPDHGTFYQAHTNRPLAGWSVFPSGCTKIQVEYAGTSLGGPFVNFGIRGTNNELSMGQYYNYLVKLGLADNFTYDQMFPDNPDETSLVQYLAFDVRHLMLDKVQLLRLGMEFAGANTSPIKQQIAVISIHPNGRADVKNLSDGGVDWDWKFAQSN